MFDPKKEPSLIVVYYDYDSEKLPSVQELKDVYKSTRILNKIKRDLTIEEKIVKIIQFIKKKRKFTFKPSDLYQSKVAKIRSSKQARESIDIMIELGLVEIVDRRKFVVRLKKNLV